MNDDVGRTAALTMGMIRFAGMCLMLILLLLLSWRSLFGLSVLNFGYVRLVQFFSTNRVSFLEAEPLCPRELLPASDHVAQDSTDVLMTLELSLRYRRDLSPYLGMGMIYLALGEPEHAEQILQIGSSQDKSNSRVHVLLGCSFLQSGKTDSAIAQWQNVPHFREWRIMRGHMLRLEGNWEASNRDYAAVVQVNPSSYLYHLMAWNYAKLGQIDKAISAYQDAVKLGQSQNNHYVPEMSRLELAKLYIRQENWQNARLELEAAIASRPNMAEAYEQLAIVYYSGFGDLRFANSLLLRAIEVDANAVKPYLYLGSFNRAQKEYAVAEKWLSVGIALPSNTWTPWLHGELGRVYLEQGRYLEAIPELKAVVDAVPTDIWYLELLGDAYRQLGELDEAARYYQEALALNPDHDRIKNKIMTLRNSQP